MTDHLSGSASEGEASPEWRAALGRHVAGPIFMHYEVELRELLYEADGTGGLRVTGSMWKPVRVFNKDTVPMVLTFEALSAAQAYVGRNQPGAVRIVREVVEAGES